MKFHTEQSLKELHPQLQDMLVKLRARRNFNVEDYVKAKARIINDYMAKAKLKSCVVAVSGGIDSALTLALAHYASKQPGSPIEKIVPIALPVFKSDFTTNQEDATDRGQELMEAFGMTRHTIDLTRAFTELKSAVDESIGVTGEPWAAGQLVAYTRTPAIYYVTSLMSQIEKPAIVCGTTNRDEGAYLGYFGKASDGMVDVQFISDLHKSEIRKAAEFLGVPESIAKAVPTGDMFDGRVDEEVFGSVYDFVELFLLLKSLESKEDRDSYVNALDEKALEQFNVLSGRLEDLHRYNGHKYIGKSPAVHLDVLESGVPGGWPTGCEKVESEPKGKEFFVNAFDFSPDIWAKFHQHDNQSKADNLPLEEGNGYKGYKIQGLLEDSEREVLLDQVNAHGWKPVGIDGIMSHYKEGDPIGSWRASSFSPEFGRLLWKRISPHIPAIKMMNDNNVFDAEGKYLWRPIGISPLFRFIKYTEGGLLVPHYDAPFTYPTGQKTLMTLVIYLNAKDIQGGLTRFLKDPQIHLSSDKKDYSDWKRFANDDEILFGVDPKPGAAVIFDHRILHDSLQISGDGEKVIIRTDIVFAPCGQK